VGSQVGVGLLLEQPGAEITHQFDDTGFPLVEGDEVGLVFGVEHQVEGRSGVTQELFFQRLLVRRFTRMFTHDASSNRTPLLTRSYPTASHLAQLRDYTLLLGTV
jgi:hypothetical protein